MFTSQFPHALFRIYGSSNFDKFGFRIKYFLVIASRVFALR